MTTQVKSRDVSLEEAEEIIRDCKEAMAQEKKDTTLEQQLFSWEEWDSVDEGVYVYTGITLNQDIGNGSLVWEKGHKFSHATVNYRNSTVCFYTVEHDEVGHTYPLVLGVGERLEPTQFDDLPLDHPSLEEEERDTLLDVDPSVSAAGKLSHEGLLDAARAGAELGTCDEDD